jgi:hypothetical protein
MKSKLLATAVGLALLGASAVALADDGRGYRYGHDRGHRNYERQDFGRPQHWSHRQRDDWRHQYHGHGYRHRHWGWYRHHHGWHGPYYRHHSYAPKPYGYDDEGVTIIFKGRFD